MLEELERRNYTESTTRACVRTIADFAAYFHRPPDQLGPEQIREYIAYLFRVRKLTDNTVNQRVGALRFFFIKTLKRSWSVEETPYPKKRIHLPVILSQDEVGRLIESALTPATPCDLAVTLPPTTHCPSQPAPSDASGTIGDSTPPLWCCPHCGGPMILLERLSAVEARLRSPPQSLQQYP